MRCGVSVIAASNALIPKLAGALVLSGAELNADAANTGVAVVVTISTGAESGYSRGSSRRD